MKSCRGKLFEEFPPVTKEEWESAIFNDLKGVDYEKKLIWNTGEGFHVKPYYIEEDIKNLSHVKYGVDEFPYVRGSKIGYNNWEIQQDIFVFDIDRANAFALEALERGATGLCFITQQNIQKPQHLYKLLQNIYFQCVDLSFQACQKAPQIFQWLCNLYKTRGISAENAKGAINYNPLGVLTTYGDWIENEKYDFENAKDIILQGKELLPGYRILLANGLLIREAGSSIIQELAFTLSAANEYLWRLTDLGLRIEDVAPKIQFNFSIGSNYFLEIAKIRAFRMLWAKVVEAYMPSSLEVAKAYIHATTTLSNMTLYDPYVNILRATTESMSAILGGVDSLSVRPFNSVYQQPDSFSYRIARNTQIILKNEAYFDKVSDPAAGSYYIEKLTDNIANEAWKLFVDVEQQGGYSQAIIKGFIQEQVKNTAIKLYADVASRKYTMVGTNQYPNFHEQMLQNIDNAVYDSKQPIASKPIAQPLQRIRIANEIEQLRLKTEKHAYRPKVFMLTIGNLAMRLARSQFSCNFFAVAGFEVIDNNGFSTIADGINAALNAKANIVVLCSSDDEYITYAPEAFKLLSNKAIFVIAGNPPCIEELKAHGIENFISIRSNIIETLKYYQQLLNINE